MSLGAKSRKLFFLAVNTGFVERGLPDRRCRDFYAERSRSGLYCAIVGNVVFPGGVGSNDACAEISSSDAWRQLAEGISEQGTLPGIQLTTAWRGYRGMKRFISVAGAHVPQEYRQVPASMSPLDVKTTFDALYRGSELAFEAGFRHLQLHAAHGYLFSLLVDRRLSPHSDLAADLVRRWVHDVASWGGESSLRFSLWTGHPSIDKHGQSQFIEIIVSLPVDYLDVSAGFYNVDKRLIYPTLPDVLSSRRTGTLDLARRYPHIQFIMSGKSSGAWDPSLPANVHVGICRDLIANPNFLRDRDQGCNDCMKCHYFSRGQSYLTCGRWTYPRVLPFPVKQA